MEAKVLLGLILLIVAVLAYLVTRRKSFREREHLERQREAEKRDSEYFESVQATEERDNAFKRERKDKGFHTP